MAACERKFGEESLVWENKLREADARALELEREWQARMLEVDQEWSKSIYWVGGWVYMGCEWEKQ